MQSSETSSPRPRLEPVTTLPATGTTGTVVSLRPKQHTHAATARVLLVVGGVLLFLTSLFVWIDRTVLTTSGFVGAVDSTLQKENVQERLAEVITTQIVQSEEYRRFIDEDLPSPASALEPIIRSRAQPLIEDAVQQILATDFVGAASTAILTNLHTQIVALLEDHSNVAEVRDDQIVLDLRDQVERTLDSIGINASSALNSSQADSLIGDAGTIVLVKDAGPLREVSWVVKNWDTFTAVLLIGTLVAFAGTIALRGDRLHGIFRVGATFVTVGVITLLIAAVSILALRVTEPDMIVLQEFVRDLMTMLRRQAAFMIALGIVAIVLCDVRVHRLISRGADTLSARLGNIDSTIIIVAGAVLGLLLLLAI